jgi:hypothetical protein
LKITFEFVIAESEKFAISFSIDLQFAAKEQTRKKNLSRLHKLLQKIKLSLKFLRKIFEDNLGKKSRPKKTEKKRRKSQLS